MILRKIFRLNDQSGFVMPTVIFLMMIMSVVAYAALLQASNGLNLTYKQSYTQMARVASKGAIDYAQEQFDKAPCGAYTGTAEQDLVSNAHYRVTFKAEVTSTSVDGLEKTIKGTGSVYLPKLASTAQYVYDVRSEIIRTYALCKTPLDFGPLVWLDSSNTASLKKTITSTSVVGQVGLNVLNLLTPNDSVEELVSNGNQGAASWLSGDLEMHTCDSLEFLLITCITSGSKDQYVGLAFSNFNIPKNSVISSAIIKLTGSAASSGGSVTHRTYGLYNTSTNPHVPLFTSSLGASNQVRSRITTANLHTTALTDTVVNSLPANQTVNFDVTSIAQEMINNANWDPTNNGGRIGFGVLRQAGTGSQTVCKGNIGALPLSCVGKGPQLTITYTPTTLYQANNGDTLAEWDDLSGNANHARFAYGTAPTRVDNQINSLPVVRFNNGTLVSTLTTVLTGKREMTVFAVVKPNFGTSASDGRIITGMTSTSANDTGGSTAIIPLLRDGSGNGFSSNYSGSGTTNRTDYLCGATCSSTPYIFSSVFDIDGATNTITSILKGNGQPAASKSGIAPAGSPYTFGINQLYYGGRRNLTGGSAVGTDYLNGDYAELVVYDKVLECRQIEAIEEYLRSKWAISGTPYTSTCPDVPIPTL